MTKCKICSKSFKNIKSLVNHIVWKHKMTSKDYYDRYFLINNENICICGKQKNFTSLSTGYRQFCKSCKGTRNNFSLYNCKICNKTIKGRTKFAYHLKQHNITQEKYYTYFLNNNIHPLCPTCNNSLPFRSLEIGFATFCSMKCRILFNTDLREKNIICKICNEKFQSSHKLQHHLSVKHDISCQQYYDKFLKKENESRCLCCSEKTTFSCLSRGYNKYCSKKCANQSTVEKRFQNKNLYLPKSDSQAYKYQVQKYTMRIKKYIPNIELCGQDFELDHKFSISQGRRLNILPWILAIPFNLEVLSKEQNQNKKYKCSISKKELLDDYFKNKDYYDKILNLS